MFSETELSELPLRDLIIIWEHKKMTELESLKNSLENEIKEERDEIIKKELEKFKPSLPDDVMFLILIFLPLSERIHKISKLSRETRRMLQSKVPRFLQSRGVLKVNVQNLMNTV